MMPMRFSLLVLGLVVLAGCSSDKSSEQNTPTPPPVNHTPEANTPESNSPESNAPEANAPEANAPDPKGTEVPPKTPTKPEPKTPPAIAEPGTQGYKPVKEVEAVAILQSAEKSMAAMRNYRMGQKVQFFSPVGKGGSEGLISVFKDPQNYVIRYAKIMKLPSKQYNYESFTELGRGGKTQTMMGEKYQPGRQSLDADGLANFQNDFTQRVVNGCTGQSSLSDIAKLAAKRGWQTIVERKTLDVGSYKRVILRDTKGTKKTIQITISEKANLPVEILIDENTPKKPSRYTARIDWQQSDKPLTDQDIAPGVKTDPVKGMGEMGKS